MTGKNNNWMHPSENNWNELISLIDKEIKHERSEQSIFKLCSGGISTQWDEWVYSFSKNELQKKIQYLIRVYEKTRLNKDFKGKGRIKWDRRLRYCLERNIKLKFDESKIVKSLYKPYSVQYLYFDNYVNGMIDRWNDMYKNEEISKYIAINHGSSIFICFGSDKIIQQDALAIGGGSTQCLPLYYYTIKDERIDNITNWALQLFNDYYRQNEPASPVCYAGSRELRAEFLLDIPPANTITKEAIFHYVYAVLHHPAYRTKYALNLKRGFPRIPLYDNFQQWAAWGKNLMDLHINYETVAPYPLERKNVVMEPKEGVNIDKFF